MKYSSAWYPTHAHLVDLDDTLSACRCVFPGWMASLHRWTISISVDARSTIPQQSMDSDSDFYGMLVYETSSKNRPERN